MKGPRRRNHTGHPSRTSRRASLAETNAEEATPHDMISGTPGGTDFQSCYFVGTFPEGTVAPQELDSTGLPGPVGVALGLARAEEPAKAPRRAIGRNSGASSPAS